MATYHPSITDEQAALIRAAPMFFTASADPRLACGPDGVGPVNVSPKGGVKLHIIGPNRVAYLDYLGSGNETARHCAAGGPITVMICSFEEGDAAVVRLFGKARATPLADVSADGGTVRFAVPGLTGDASFAGTLAADGSAIGGTFTQNGAKFPLVLLRMT